jgi:hypothetical protein
MSDPMFFDADASVARAGRALGHHAARREPLVRALCDRVLRPLVRTRFARPDVVSIQFFLRPVEAFVDYVHPRTGKTFGAVVPAHDRRDLGMAWDRFLSSATSATEAVETFLDDVMLMVSVARTFNLPGEPAHESAAALESRFLELWHASGVVELAEALDVAPDPALPGRDAPDVAPHTTLDQHNELAFPQRCIAY